MSVTKETLIKNYTLCLEDRSASVFIGSGLSYDACKLDWDALVSPFINELEDNDTDPIVGIQYYITQKNIDPIEFKATEIAPKFKNLTHDNRHVILAKLPIRNYWTTNFDTLIEDALTACKEERDVMNNNDSFISVSERRDNVVYKLHGDVTSPESIVISKDDYEKYTVSHNHFLTALSNELNTNTMLFLGYSLSDPDINNIFNHVRLNSNKVGTHYLILKKDNTKIQEYKIKEYEKYGIVTCLIDEYNEIEEILQEIYKLYMSRKVLISGSSCGDYGNYSTEEAERMLYKLGYELINRFKDQEVNIVTGYGKGVGPFILEGASEAIAINNLDFGKRVLVYPFPKSYYGIPDSLRSPELIAHFKHYREKMIEKCGIVFFLFGNKEQNGEIVDASGVKEEFDIAVKQGKYVFPIGSTGWEAKKLADDVLGNYSKYNKTSKEVEKLFYELNIDGISSDDIIEKVISIIDLLVYRS